MRVQDVLEYKTRSGRDIEITRRQDVEAGRGFNEQWVVHQLDAYVGGDHAGYLKISYVPRERMKKMIPSLINFAYEQAFPMDKKHVHWKKLDVEEKRKILTFVILTRNRIRHPEFDLNQSIEGERSVKEMSESELDFYLGIVDKMKHNPEKAQEYRDFVQFHVDRPLVDFIRVFENFQRQRIAMALYQAGALWLKQEFGLFLHASGLQQPEAHMAWEKMQRKGWVEPAPGDSSRRIINPEKISQDS